MNRNQKEKLARIEIRTEPSKKEKVRRLAEKCNLSLSEYMIQRALGYEPNTALPNAFFTVYQKLCDVANQAEINGFAETQVALNELIKFTHSCLVRPYRRTAKEIEEEMELLLQQDSGL